MKNNIFNALNEIKAEQQLKDDTYTFLTKKIYDKRINRLKRFTVAMASIAIFFFAGLFSYKLYFTEASFVDIDVNPSIELTLNRFDRVIEIHAYNDDGDIVLKEVDIQHKNYKDALKLLIDKMIELDYLTDKGLFTATLQSMNSKNETELLRSLKAYIAFILQSDSKDLEPNVFPVDSTIKIHSHDQNLTPAKYLAILELQKFEPSITFDECRSHTIGEIEQQTHEHMDNEHEDSHMNNYVDSTEDCNDQDEERHHNKKEH